MERMRRIWHLSYISVRAAVLMPEPFQPVTLDWNEPSASKSGSGIIDITCFPGK